MNDLLALRFPVAVLEKALVEVQLLLDLLAHVIDGQVVPVGAVVDALNRFGELFLDGCLFGRHGALLQREKQQEEIG